MRGDRPSLTASVVAAFRALYTHMPDSLRLAPDPLAEDLVPSAFALPAKAITFAPGAALAMHRALGAATFGLTFHIALRTRAIDDALREGVRAGATELVLLGAGLDTRALRLEALRDVRAFEVDHPSTQRYKVARLAAVHAPAPLAQELVRVPVDFERDRLEDALPKSGFDPKARSFWIWEGVVVYLTLEAIDTTLAAIASLSAPGSRVALTYTEQPGSGERSIAQWTMPFAKSGLWALGEPLRSLFTREALWKRIEKAGFRKVSDESTTDWARRYWPNETGARDIERLAIAERTGG